MKMGGQGSVKLSAFHGKLAWRLALAGLFISVVLGDSVWIHQRNVIGEAIIDRALLGAAHFNAQIEPLIDVSGVSDREAVQRELEAFGSRPVPDPKGKFVRVLVYDAGGGVVADLVDEGYGHIDAVKSLVSGGPSAFPAVGAYTLEVVRLAQTPHVLIVLPLTGRSGEPVAYMEGVFAVSSEALAGIRRRVWETVFWVIAIVLVTTALLYPTILTLMRRLTRLSLNLLDANLETLKVLGSAIAKRDNDTDAHNYRVTLLSVRFAEALGLEPREIQSLIKGAFLHDVGKIGIRDSILLKPGHLTDEEFQVMKTHVRHGKEICERSAWLRDAVDVVGHHHEKYDGSGYGDGLNGAAIPVRARIFSIADVFDALTSRRPYKEPFSLEETIEILKKGRGIHFDPNLLDPFLEMAPDLYKEIAGRQDEGLRQEVERLTQRYFSEGTEIHYAG
jgi:HD-GYP domain-containing protein (c-di-GMP phosphodiesterase class II)